jgi:hypothetical protein
VILFHDLLNVEAVAKGAFAALKWVLGDAM